MGSSSAHPNLRQRPISSADVIANERAFPPIQLESLSLPQLKALQLSVAGRSFTLRFWTKSYLIRKLRKHFDHIEFDDQLLHKEGTTHLTHLELEEACVERGLHIQGLTTEELREELDEWLKISSYNPQLAQSLLIHAHAFLYINLTLQRQDKNTG